MAQEKTSEPMPRPNEPPKKDGFGLATMLGLVVAICLLLVMGYYGQKLDKRVTALETSTSQEMNLFKAQHTADMLLLKERQQKFDEALAVLAAKPDVNERIALLEQWIEFADPSLRASFQQMLQRDEMLRQWLLQLGARVDALEKPPVVTLPPVVKPVERPKPVVRPKPVTRPKVTKPKPQKRCNKPVTICKGENPMVCMVQ